MLYLYKENKQRISILILQIMKKIFNSITGTDILILLGLLALIAVIVCFLVAYQSGNTVVTAYAGFLLFAGVPVVLVACTCK